MKVPDEYFALQLRFAEQLARLTHLGFEDAVDRYTNVRKRLRLEEVADWRLLLRALAGKTGDEGLSLIVETYEKSDSRVHNPFGCFAFAVHNEETLRIHFTNPDPDSGISPLAATELDKRRAELRHLFSGVHSEHPRVRMLVGTSWLYNIEAYRRLFPESYLASATPMQINGPFNGSSFWGQFIDHQGELKQALAAQFEAGFPSISPDAVWRSFPLPALRLEAPIEVLYHHFLDGK